MPSPSLLTTSEAALLLRLSERGVRAMCAAGRLPGAVKVGADWRIRAEALERLLGTTPPTPIPFSARVARETRQSAPLTAEERRFFGLDDATGARTHGRRQAADAGNRKARLAG